jgi:predicted dehydrogenase
MSSLNRRHFLAASALSLSALTVTRAADRPSEKIRLGLIGARIRGRQLLKTLSGLPDAEIVAVCDPDKNVSAETVKLLPRDREVLVVQDLRKLLDNKSIDAVVIAAPDHWHALAAIWSCQAGKDVYVEKPASHNLVEGRRMIEAARKYNRVMQVGTQRRSAPHVQKAVEFVRSGKLGKVPFARCWIAGSRKSIGHKPDAPVPEGVDYDIWLGPAAKTPFNPNRFHYEWHWHWDLGTGELGNNGIHGLDMARWILGVEAPVRVSSAGGKFFYNDDRKTPDTQISTFDFDHCTLIWEHRIWAKSGPHGEPWGVELCGEKGTMVFDKKGWHIEDGVEASEKISEAEKAHMANFLECVRSRKRPNADIEEGHRSTTLCHLGNIAFRTAHTLKFDAAHETLIDDPEACKLLGRTYRKPFEVPEKV